MSITQARPALHQSESSSPPLALIVIELIAEASAGSPRSLRMPSRSASIAPPTTGPLASARSSVAACTCSIPRKTNEN